MSGVGALDCKRWMQQLQRKCHCAMALHCKSVHQQAAAPVLEQWLGASPLVTGGPTRLGHHLVSEHALPYRLLL